MFGNIHKYIANSFCDSVIAPAIWVVGTQLYTVLKYVNPVNLQKKLLEIRKMEPEFSRQIRESNDKCLNAILKYGLKEIKLTVRRKSLPSWQEMAGKQYPKTFLTEVLRYLDEYNAVAASR